MSVQELGKPVPEKIRLQCKTYMVRLLEVYTTFGGPLKTENFLQLHSKFIDCVLASKMEDKISRPVWGRLLVIFIFNDALAITRPLSYFRSSDRMVLASQCDITLRPLELDAVDVIVGNISLQWSGKCCIDLSQLWPCNSEGPCISQIKPCVCGHFGSP